MNGRKYDRLFVTDVNGENLLLVNDNEMVSHCCWYGDHQIISYMRRFEYGDDYFICNLINLEIKPLFLNVSESFGDGHPSIANNRMIFDTYPNKSRMKMIKMFELEKNVMVDIAELYESMSFYGETRCDLHPRWSFDGTKIFLALLTA